MTLTLLDLYNATASQEWAMYDNDATTTAEMEQSLVLAINKSILDIYTSYNFPFRLRTHLILTVPYIDTYDAPNGIIATDNNENYIIKCNTKLLKFMENHTDLDYRIGVPEGFYLENDKLVIYPTPIEKNMITIDYYTLVIGEDNNGEEIYTLSNADDRLLVPIYLEALIQDAIITRTMINTIASESDENYTAYLKQADRAQKKLIKYSKGIIKNKIVKI